jgi:transcriptional regulator with GAF, ATPase, and Fis domain
MKRVSDIDKNVFFREGTLRICSSLNPHTVLDQLLNYVKDVIPASGASLGLIDLNSFTMQITAQVSLDRTERQCPFTIMLHKDHKERYNRWLTKDKFLILNDIDLHEPIWEREVPKLVFAPTGSLMLINLDLQDQRLGTFAIYTKEKNQYTEEHLRLIIMLHDPLAIAMSNALHYQEVMLSRETLADDNRYLYQQLLQVSGEAIVGADSGLKEVMEKVRQVAQLDSSVLLLGETGVGKEIIANAIHRYSDRSGGPFIKVNCGAIPETLMDSELFGHEKGAFTGAISQKRGRFERADKGTIFLDEIGELSPLAQVRLLRVIQNKEIERVGGTSTIPINTRILSATHQDLVQMVQQGRFREDLWFRLNVFPIMIPPLRDRRTDIPELVYYFIKRKTAELKIHNPPAADPDELKRLMAYHWPGNIRELENMIERALIQSRGEKDIRELRFENPWLTSGVNRANEEDDTKETFLSLDEIDRYHIQKALKFTKGRVHGPNGAAQLLHVNSSTLRAKMTKLGVSYGRRAK